jgi:PAS domain S-box-containing protein
VTPHQGSLATDDRHLPWVIANLNFRFHTGVLACLVATMAYLSARLGGVIVINAPQRLWPLWPGCALLVAILLLVPRKIWPILVPAGLAGFIAYDLQAGESIRSIAWFILADTLEILIAAWGVSYSLNGLPRLNGLKALAKYSFFTVILASLVVSSIGVRGLNGDRWLSWRISFLSEGLAFLTVTPAILGWFGKGRAWVRAFRAYYLEAAVLIPAVISLSYFVFVARETRTPPALFYSLVPLLLWSALRFGSTGASSCVTIIALLSTWGAVHGRGPFAESDPINNVLSIQLFLLFTAAPFMVLAGVVEEHEQDERELREGEERFRLVADTAPVLIWMSGTDKLCSFFNQGWLDFTGRSMEDEVGNGWASGVHPDDLEVCLETYSASFDARADFEMEYRLRRFDREYRWVIHHGVPRFESDGTFCGYIGSCIDITDQKSSAESLQALTGRLIHAQEEERARIARELHDDFNQGLALQCIDLEQLLKKLPESEVQGRAMLLKLLRGTKAMSKDLRSLSHQLHSSKLELVGLVSALRGFCEEIAEKYKIEVHFTECGTPLNIPKDVALCLFRVTQEAIGNVVKHSQAKRAQVELGANEYGVSLRIADEGRGFDPDGVHPGAGLGLVGMTERLRLVKGRLLIRSELMQGTEIFAEVPLSVSPNEGGQDRWPQEGRNHETHSCTVGG